MDVIRRSSFWNKHSRQPSNEAHLKLKTLSCDTSIEYFTLFLKRFELFIIKKYWNLFSRRKKHFFWSKKTKQTRHEKKMEQLCFPVWKKIQLLFRIGRKRSWHQNIPRKSPRQRRPKQQQQLVGIEEAPQKTNLNSMHRVRCVRPISIGSPKQVDTSSKTNTAAAQVLKAR